MGFLNKTLKALKLKGKKEEKEANKDVSDVKIDLKKDDKIQDGNKETKREPKKEPKKELKENTKDAYKVLIKPLVSEKASEASKFNQYIFVVNKNANKPEIKKAIEAVYGIKPVRVNIINTQGKKVRSGRFYGKRKDWKKAIITLPKGKSIQIYEGL